jgi:hypothetical protein
MRRRWLIVLVVAAALVVTPVLISAFPASRSAISALDLAARIRASGAVAWSGLVRTIGSLDVPASASFANVGQLLGESSDIRVWWRRPDSWRVDRIRSTGEEDLVRRGDRTVRWVFESETATISPVSSIRLPDASDLLPPTLGRWMLQGARNDELARLPALRIAGVDAPGLRLVPHEAGTTIGHVDVWADVTSGLPLRVEVYGAGHAPPVLTSWMTEVTLADPSRASTRFRPPEGIRVERDQSVDVASAANALTSEQMPAALGGLPRRGELGSGAVGIYGRGPTFLLAVPLRGDVFYPLQEQLQSSAAAAEVDVGTLLAAGPIDLLSVPHRFGYGGVLLAGTVTADALKQAAAELLARP